MMSRCPRVQTPEHPVTDYHSSLAAGVQGFWLNGSNWLSQNHCTEAGGGVGCPKVGLQFLAKIGLIAHGAPAQPRTDFVQLALDISVSKITGALAGIKATPGNLLGQRKAPA